ncbi:methyl-accepting chemotaxis protein, partial [Leptospira ellisii]|uniref:methyl-accepting chemotaxis protein n=1 Tax=Leptospira ellisii TaxID=2023197 RepID=UPI00311A993B
MGFPCAGFRFFQNEPLRSGEQGRGFAVVADEISKLADQTAKTIKEIHNLISAGNEAMNDNTEIVRQGTHTISQVIEDVNEITDMTETFFETLREQTESRSKLSGIF